jgi:hypothetical protein
MDIRPAIIPFNPTAEFLNNIILPSLSINITKWSTNDHWLKIITTPRSRRNPNTDSRAAKVEHNKNYLRKFVSHSSATTLSVTADNPLETTQTTLSRSPVFSTGFQVHESSANFAKRTIPEHSWPQFRHASTCFASIVWDGTVCIKST